MLNEKLIERVSNFAPREVVDAVADALEAADKRIAELEKYGRVQDPLADRIAELERKLAVAREALEFCWRDVPMSEYAFDLIEQALAQIGGEDAAG